MNNKHFERRLFAISFVSGFIIALFCMSPHASENPGIEITSASENANPTITFDVNNPSQDLSYKEVDHFLDGMNKQQVKYAAAKPTKNQVILSENPIEIPRFLSKPTQKPESQPIPYAPVTLADLGMQMTPEAQIASAEHFQMENNDTMTLPSEPEFIHVPITAENAARAFSLIHNQLTSDSTLSFLYDLSRLVFACSGLIIMCMLILSRVRRTVRAHQAAKFTGMLGQSTELVGEGELFDFNDVPLSMQTLPVNSTYLNMMWHLGRFTHDNGVNTYFYMAFYIPPHQKYAAALRRKRVRKETESNT